MKKKTSGSKLSLNKKVITSMDNKFQAAVQGGEAIPTTGCPVTNKICNSIVRLCFPDTAFSILC